MKTFWQVILFLLIFILSCGVSKDRYQAQVMRTQELSAHEGDLLSRLDASGLQIEKLKKSLEEKSSELEEFKGKFEKATETNADLRVRLQTLTNSEISLKSSLEDCKGEKNNIQASLDSVQGELKSEKNSSLELKDDLETCRGGLSDLKAKADLLSEQKRLAEQEKREKIDEMSNTYEDLLEGMKEEVDKGRITISQLKGKLSVNLLDEIIFDSGRSDIKTDGMKVLDRLGELLGNLDDKLIVVEGHTDNVAIRGDLAKRFPTNWELSTARATSVVRYLEETVGVPPTRLSAVGFGENRPLAPNDTPEGRAGNRRIEIKLVPIAAPLVADTEKNEEAADDVIVDPTE